MAAAPALGFWLRRGRYLEGISWLTLERDHIIHQVALSCLHPIAGYSWFGTTAQAHRWTRPKQGERRVHKLGRLRWQTLRVLLAAWGPRLVPSRAPANLSIWQAEEVRTYRMEAHRVKAGTGGPLQELWVFCAASGHPGCRLPGLSEPLQCPSCTCSQLPFPSSALRRQCLWQEERPPEGQKSKGQLKTGQLRAQSPFSRTGWPEGSWPTSKTLSWLLTQGQGHPLL